MSVGAPDQPAARPGGLATDRAGMLALLAAAAVCVGGAIQATDGRYSERALALLLPALALTLLGLALPRLAPLERHGANAITLVLGVGAMLQLALLATDLPAMYIQAGDAAAYRPFYGLLAVAGVLIGSGLAPKPWLRGAELPLLLAVHLGMGLWQIYASPDPYIDVFVFQRDSLDALLGGVDPYAITFPDIYGGPSPFYGPGLVVDGRVQTGFVYPPVNLLLELPGHVLGDVRYSHLALMTAGGALMARARPGRLAFAAAAVYLFTPRAFFVLEQSWTEPDVVFLLALTLFCAMRAPRIMPYALGVLLVSKQYLIVAAPLVFLLAPRPFGWRGFNAFIAKAAVAGLLMTLPFALRHPSGFWHSVVMLQFYQPFRYDALSIPAALAADGSAPLGAWLAFAMLLPMTVLAILRAPRTPSGFAAALGAVSLVFFAFNKQAFANYYFFVIGALCAAVATAAPRPAERALS